MSQKINAKIGDIFGCYEVIEEPFIKGDHQYAKVKCTVCGAISVKAVSQMKLRPVKNCAKCKGLPHRKYKHPEKGDIINGGEILSVTKVPPYSAIRVSCKCTKCGHVCENVLWSCMRLYAKCPECLEAKNQEAKAHRAGLKKTKEEQIRKARAENFWQTLLNRTSTEAAKRSIDVTITAQDLKDLYEKQKGCCALTGVKFTNIINKRDTDVSVDRIDPVKPYCKDNIQLLLPIVNISKYIMNQEEFIQMCKLVVNHANQQPSQDSTTLEGSETIAGNFNSKERKKNIAAART